MNSVLQIVKLKFIFSNKTRENKTRTSDDEPIYIATIIPKLNFIYPVQVIEEGLQSIVFELIYTTALGEELYYRLEVSKGENGTFERANEKCDVKYGKRFKKVRPNASRDEKSYPSKQVGEKLKTINGSLNYKREVTGNGDIIGRNKL